jgi:hypothetical protein
MLQSRRPDVTNICTTKPWKNAPLPAATAQKQTPAATPLAGKMVRAFLSGGCRSFPGGFTNRGSGGGTAFYFS